jgi:hypothetical protein
MIQVRETSIGQPEPGSSAPELKKSVDLTLILNVYGFRGDKLPFD